jgi:uncharacterized membrane protein
MSHTDAPDRDIYLDNLRTLANVMFALCMFSSVLKIDFPARNLPDEELLAFILQSFEAFANFAVAFIFLAMYWIKFITNFNLIHRSNNIMIVLWLAYLAVLCIYPFAENLIANYPGSIVAQIGFSAIWAIVGIVGLACWSYAVYARLVDPDLDMHEARMKWLESLPEPAAALLSIVCAYHSNVAYYGALLLVLPANYFVARRYSRREVR